MCKRYRYKDSFQNDILYIFPIVILGVISSINSTGVVFLVLGKSWCIYLVYSDMALSSQFQCSASHNISSRFSSYSSISYPLLYPISIVHTNNIVIMMTTNGNFNYFCMLFLVLGKSWCIYLVYSYGFSQLNNRTLFLCTIVASRIKFINFNVVCPQLIKSLVLTIQIRYMRSLDLYTRHLLQL